MKQKFRDAYMKTAEVFAELSSARRLHVGAIIVKDDRIISIGYNGMPAGWDNNCEDKIYCDDGDWSEQQLPKTSNLPWKKYNLVTKPEVLHAETNAIAKLAKSTESGNGASLFVTHAPCLDCAKLVFQSGISSVYYRNSYRSLDGIEFLDKAGVQITKV
jgi:dCMP deaminase